MSRLESHQDSEGMRPFVTLKQEHTNAEGLSLQSLLITPVQRVPRYELLLREMEKHCPAEHWYVVRASLGQQHSRLGARTGRTR